MEKTLDIAFYEKFQRMRQRNLMRLLKLTMRFLVERAEEMAIAHGFSDFKIIYMGFLANLSPQGTTSSELATKLCVSKQAISKMTKEIESLGFIEFHAHETDGRAAVINLTEKGERLLEASLAVSEMLKTELMEIASETEVEQLIDTLQKVVGFAEKKWGIG